MSTPEAPTAPSRTIYDVQRDLDLDELLETIVSPPSCEWYEQADPAKRPCGKPATWLLTLSCGHSAYLDDEHGQRMRDWHDEAKLNGERLGCTKAYDPPAHSPYLPVTATFVRIAS